MIQRIQSVFLLLAAVCFAVLFSDGLPMLSLDEDATRSSIPPQAMLEDGLFDISDHIILIIFTILGVLLFTSSIFLFKNRKLQIRLTRIGLILTILFIVLMFVLLLQEVPLINSELADQVHLRLGAIFPILAMVFAYFAIRYINKDEKIVRSADRLR